MSERLNELQRQRALAIEQLAALERQIAAELNGTPARTLPGATAAPSAIPFPTAGASRPSLPDPGDADAIIARFRNNSSTSVQNDVRRGCFIYFFIALFLLVGGLAAFYYLHVRK